MFQTVEQLQHRNILHRGTINKFTSSLMMHSLKNHLGSVFEPTTAPLTHG